MSRLVITRGLPGSGKSTWAKAWVNEDPDGRARVNRDDLRANLYGCQRLNFTQETAITEAQRGAVLALLKAGKDVVVDDTHLRIKYARAWADLAQETGSAFEVQDFTHIPVDECIQRDAERPAPVGADVIAGLAAKFLRIPQAAEITVSPAAVEAYVPDLGNHPAWLVDMDGTLAIMCDRSPYDESRVSEDTPNGPVVEMVRALCAAGMDIIIMSGRTDACRPETIDWLEKHAVPFDAIYMRETGDGRKDAVVKRELFDRHVRDFWNVRGVLDDRQQVVNMWRSLGLVCAQVAAGDF